MKMGFMRWVDRHVGAVLLFSLEIVDFFRKRLSFKKSDDSTPRVILIQKYFGLGSILNAFPLIDLLKKKYPDSKLVFLTFESNRDLFELTGKADEVIFIRSEKASLFAWDCLRALMRLHRLGVDICIDLEFFARYSMVMSYLSGAPTRVGFFSYFNMRSALLTHPVAFNHYKHISRIFLAMGEILGFSASDAEPFFSLPSRIAQERGALIQLLGAHHKLPVVVVNPNASALCKMRKWPAKRYVELVQQLTLQNPNHVFVLIGNQAERSYIEDIYLQLPNKERVVNAAGRMSFSQLLALLETADLLISNDSGPVHIAAAYQTNTVAIYGPETPVLYRPLNPNARVLYSDLYCSPCINVLDNKSSEACQNTWCMNRISVNEVIRECKPFLQALARSASPQHPVSTH